MEPLIIAQDTGPVRRLTMNTPAKLNALSWGMLDALDEAFDDLERDQTQIRSAIICGAGKAFCAGHDLAEMREARNGPDKGKAELARLFQRCSAIMTRIHRLPQPIIAEVHGIATAAGCQLVATCDMAVAARSTRFGVNGVNIGLFCSTPMVALSRNVSRKQAFEMLTTGQFINAERAVELGLVNRVAEDGTQSQAALELAQTVAGKLGAAVRIGKRAFYEQLRMPLDDAYAYTGQVMVENMGYEDTAEGVAAFLEKRDPNWTQ